MYNRRFSDSLHNPTIKTGLIHSNVVKGSCYSAVRFLEVVFGSATSDNSEFESRVNAYRKALANYDKAVTYRRRASDR